MVCVFEGVLEIDALGGRDAVVFTGGIGENDSAIRAEVAEGCAWLGFMFDEEANRRSETYVATAESRAAALVIPTNEALEIARRTWDIACAR